MTRGQTPLLCFFARYLHPDYLLAVMMYHDQPGGLMGFEPDRDSLAASKVEMEVKLQSERSVSKESTIVRSLCLLLKRETRVTDNTSESFR